MTINTEAAILERVEATKDAATVKRVFGDAYRQGELMMIPVAAVRSAAGGGTGPGPDTAGQAGSGGGMGYAFTARPAGVFVIDGHKVSWRPAVDLVRLILAAQAALITLIAAVVVLRRRPAFPGSGSHRRRARRISPS